MKLGEFIRILERHPMDAEVQTSDGNEIIGANYNQRDHVVYIEDTDEFDDDDPDIQEGMGPDESD